MQHSRVILPYDFAGSGARDRQGHLLGEVSLSTEIPLLAETVCTNVSEQSFALGNSEKRSVFQNLSNLLVPTAQERKFVIEER